MSKLKLVSLTNTHPAILDHLGMTFVRFGEIDAEWDGNIIWSVYVSGTKVIALAKDHDDSGNYVIAEFEDTLEVVLPAIDGDEIVKQMFSEPYDNELAVVFAYEIKL